MDKSVPAGAAILLDFIRDTEVGTADRSGYDVVYGHNQGKLPKPVTTMTLTEVQKAQGSWSKRFGSSATGGYQFMKATLAGLIEEMKLATTLKLDADLQDQLAFHLLKRRGYEAFIAGKISRTEFAKRLAQEWASLPVLAATTGGVKDKAGKPRTVKRGQSFYAGDGLNKALVSPQAIEALLDKVKGVKPATNPVARPGEANLYATKAMIQIVQARLTELGYPLGSRNSKTGEFDGVVGTLTAAAIRAFRADNGLPEGEYIDADLVAALDTAKPRKLAPARENAPVEKVAEAAPEVAANWRTEVASKYGTVGLLVIAIVDWISGLFSAGQDAIQPMLTILNGFPSWVWLLLAAGVVGVLWWNHRRGRQAGVEAFRTGARL